MTFNSRVSRPVRGVLLGAVAAAALGLTGCSAEGDVDTEGDGVRIEGDVDTTTTAP